MTSLGCVLCKSWLLTYQLGRATLWSSAMATASAPTEHVRANSPDADNAEDPEDDADFVDGECGGCDQKFNEADEELGFGLCHDVQFLCAQKFSC